MQNNLQKTTEFVPITIDEKTLKEMQTVIDNCTPIIGNNTQTFTDSVVIANGMLQLRQFMNLPEVKRLVESMANTEVGFLTDRPPGKDRWDTRKKKYVKVIPYTYDETVDALLPPMLEGYRFTGNEINIISFKGMPVKKGKFRKIKEFSGVTDFTHSIGTPHKDYFDDQKENGVAKMRCQASWKLEGVRHTLGYDDDVCIIAVEFDKYSGIDKMIGLSDSKVFSRVLTRLTGNFTIEGEDGFESPDTIDVTPKKGQSDKRPLPGKQKQDENQTTQPSQSEQNKDQAVDDGIDWAMPKTEEGLSLLYNRVNEVYPGKKKELEEFLVRDPIKDRPAEFYQDFIDGLKKVVS